MKSYKEFILENKIYDYVSCIMIEIRKQLTDIKSKKYFFDFEEIYKIKFFLDVKINSIDTLPIYNSNISAKEVFDSNFDGFTIKVYIEDNVLDINKFFSLIAHEIAHVYQLISGEDKFIESFSKMISIEDFKNTVQKYKLNFLNYIYMNFEHELEARVNQTYEGWLYQRNNFTQLEDMWNVFKNNSDIYKDIIWLGDFNFNNYLKNYKKYELLELTNQFNLLYNINKININQLKNYYDNWMIIFKNNSTEYIEHLKDAITQAYNNEKRYENVESYCCFNTHLEKQDYDPNEEILKLVKKFKKLKL